MAPKKLSTKKSGRDITGEGSSATSEFDSHRFRRAKHLQRFEAIRGWSFHRERRVQLREDEYSDFQEEIARRHWKPLVTPMAKFDLEIVLEFYANAWPTKEGVRDMRSLVRGQWIPFDADALSQFLGDPLILEEDQQCEFNQRRSQADSFDEEAIAQLLCIPGQDFARTAAGRRVQIMRTRMAPTRHPLDPEKSNRALGFPALITGLCQSYGVPVTPSKAANHHGQVQIHECLYRFSLNQQGQGSALFVCPTPEQFGAEVAWPGD
ncbi:hypothetical protein HKD37_15G043291 [Glycine soja]